jgi:hypothetical protein
VHLQKWIKKEWPRSPIDLELSAVVSVRHHSLKTDVSIQERRNTLLKNLVLRLVEQEQRSSGLEHERLFSQRQLQHALKDDEFDS